MRSCRRSGQTVYTHTQNPRATRAGGSRLRVPAECGVCGEWVVKAKRAEPRGSCARLLAQGQIRKGTQRSPHQALRQGPFQAVLVHTLSIYAKGMGATASSLPRPFGKGGSSMLRPSVHLRTAPHVSIDTLPTCFFLLGRVMERGCLQKGVSPRNPQ